MIDAKGKVPEYWIVDPKLKTITVLTLSGKVYKVHGGVQGKRRRNVEVAQGIQGRGERRYCGGGREVNRNTAYLNSHWAVFGFLILVLGGWFLFVVVTLAGRGEFLVAACILVAVPLAIGCIVLVRRYQSRRILRLLQSPSPEALIAHYKKTIRPGLMSDGDAILAQGCAVAYILYGEFGQARVELESVTWTGRPPLIVGLRKVAEATLCYLDTREFEQGLAIAKSAQQLADVPSGFPGAAKNSIAFESIVLIGEILVGRARPSTITELEANFDVLPETAKLLIAWALAQEHDNYDSDRRQEMRDFVKRIGPHCRALALPEIRREI